VKKIKFLRLQREAEL